MPALEFDCRPQVSNYTAFMVLSDLDLGVLQLTKSRNLEKRKKGIEEIVLNRSTAPRTICEKEMKEGPNNALWFVVVT